MKTLKILVACYFALVVLLGAGIIIGMLVATACCEIYAATH